MKESIFIFFIIIFIYIFLFLNKNNVIYIEAKTGAKFLVNNDNLKKEKAELLYQVVENMYKLKNHMTKNINIFTEYNKYIIQLDKNFNETRTSIYETAEDSDLTSYSVNKGEELSFCLKSKKTNKIHDLNLLMYVAIHEMAHIACPEIGHGALFKKIFKKLLTESININIYIKIDYSETPVEYCGMILTSSIV